MPDDPVQTKAYREPLADDPRETARILARGVQRSFAQHGWSCLAEFTLRNGLRVDLIVLDGEGGVSVVEIKSSETDFRTDHKWPGYLDYCDRFYFAVASDFPLALIPEHCGLIVADGYDAVIRRESPLRRLHASRRKMLTLRFAQVAADRLLRQLDPLP
jgi:hypothetical protein